MLQKQWSQAQRQNWVQCQKALDPENVVFLICEDELISCSRVWVWIYAQHHMQAQMDWYAQVREDGPPNILHHQNMQ